MFIQMCGPMKTLPLVIHTTGIDLKKYAGGIKYVHYLIYVNCSM